MFKSCFVVAWALLGSVSQVSAQTPPVVAWEFVGPDSGRVVSFALPNVGDGLPYGAARPAYASLSFISYDFTYRYRNDIYRLDDPAGGPAVPDENAAWTPLGWFGSIEIYASDDDLLVSLIGAGPHPFSRSVDGGKTWQDIETYCNNGSDLIKTRGPGREGALWLVNEGMCRSDDDGVTWSVVATEGILGAFLTFDLAELPPSVELPGGRLLVAAANGVAFSDDSGATWLPSSMWQEFRWAAYDLDLASDAQHPYGGTIYASVRDFYFENRGYITIHASDDGGETWELRHRFVFGEHGLDRIDRFSSLVVLGDGSLVVGLNMGFSGRKRSVGAVVWSGDGGRTWTELGPKTPWIGERPPVGACGSAGGGGCPGGAWPGWNPSHLAVDREGRVWVGTDNGVWRTRGAAWAVAGEVAPDPTASLAVRVWPNPTGGPATVSLKLAAPEAVCVSVYDVRGREVLTVHDGAATDGQRWTVETAGLAPGAYVVRVASASGTATAGLTVAR